MARDDFDSLLPPAEKRPTPAPAWVALVAAWAGLLMLLASVVFIFLPGSVNPRAERLTLRHVARLAVHRHLHVRDYKRTPGPLSATHA